MVGSKIVLIGAGNVATHLGKAFLKKGINIVQIYSRTESSAIELAEALSVPYTTSLENIVCDADLYIVALKDVVLHELIPLIVKGRENAFFVHVSGSLPMNIWEGYAKNYGVLYPMQTFSKQREVDFREVSFFVEANHQIGIEALKDLAGKLSPKVYELTSEQRKYLHIAAVFACNFTNHMYALCDRLLKAQGVPFEVMLPLIDETARKVHELKPQDAQTGPAIRNDKNIIESHLNMLDDEPGLKEIYEMISNSIHRL